MFEVTFLLILLSLFSRIYSKTHVFNWTAAWGSADVDGLGARPVITCNGEFPWPDIRVDKGDRLEIYLTNGLNDSSTMTSLHFHGLHQVNTNQMDGPPMVTTCPISQGDTMLFNFTVDSNVGTYWYHSHTLGQYEDGFRGMFIINDGENNKNYPYDYDEEVVLSLADWYSKTVDQLLPDFMSVYNPTGAEPIPRNLLINNTMNLTWSVKPDTAYLLRIGNFGGFVSQYFWIEDHEMTVVQIDGEYVKPNTTERLYITVGQRYSVLVHTKNSTERNYAIMQKFDDTMLDTIPSDLRLNCTSFMMYNDSLAKPDEHIVDSLDFLDDFYLVPMNETEILPDPDHRITLDVVMDNLIDGVNYAFFNNITYLQPKVPTLMTALSAGDNATDAIVYGSNTNTFVLEKDEIVEIVVNNLDTGVHPFHLHGHVFQTIVRDRTYDSDVGEDPHAYDPDDHAPFPQYPMARDTIFLRPQSNFVIRFKANNPGVWIFHCHIEWHLLQGLAIVLVEDPLSIQASYSQQITQNHLEVCARSNISTKGNAAGNTEDFYDLRGESVQPKFIPSGFTKKGIIAMTFSCLAGVLGIATIVVYGMMDLDSKPVSLGIDSENTNSLDFLSLKGGDEAKQFDDDDWKKEGTENQTQESENLLDKFGNMLRKKY
ncbi:ferroxidase FET3 PWA37_005055 [Arxiozyma heterogenica]|uniref:ferroxidase FET3 n=1 Tax=Arxiozyma heterogenica TaxID=278026 RepID=UPI002F1149BA